MSSHSFDVAIATKYDIETAIMLQHFCFWYQRNKANNRNFHDGTYWTYNSIAAFTEMFPYMSNDQMRRVIKRMIENDLIRKGNYSTNKYDRTSWYSLSVEGAKLLGVFDSWNYDMQKFHLANPENGKIENTESITDSNTDVTSDSNTERGNFENFENEISLSLSKEEVKRNRIDNKSKSNKTVTDDDIAECKDPVKAYELLLAYRSQEMGYGKSSIPFFFKDQIAFHVKKDLAEAWAAHLYMLSGRKDRNIDNVPVLLAEFKRIMNAENDKPTMGKKGLKPVENREMDYSSFNQDIILDA